MNVHAQGESWSLFHGDCREVLASLPDCSVDSVVTDPPYELGFMGKSWDASGIAYNVELWAEVLRVLKPGGHLVAFGGTRTYHRMAVAIEDAGFEIRDSLHWVYGSGFPKSLDVSKAIDKVNGAEGQFGEPKSAAHAGWIDRGRMRGDNGHEGHQRPWMDDPEAVDRNARQYLPATDAAKQWEGWGTALKPAHEPIVLARKPLIGTVAANVLEHGTGGLNIDGTRVGTDAGWSYPNGAGGNTFHGQDRRNEPEMSSGGRWPANVIFDTEAGALLDEQSGESKSPPIGSVCKSGTGQMPLKARQLERPNGHGDSGGASRFFTSIDWNPEIDVPFRYVPKPSKRERTCEGTVSGSHPTVKPLALMRWLVRLVTPPNGTVLEPFAGSGTTLMACVHEGFQSIGIEMTDEYLPIIEGRVKWAEDNMPEPPTEPDQLSLLG
jgi:DNA modification methylase